MAKQGLHMLPPAVSLNQGLELLSKITNIVSVIGELKSELKYSPVGNHLLSLLFLAESVQSTRIEGTQVTFSDMIDVQYDKRKQLERQKVTNYQLALNEGIRLIKNENMPFSTRLIKDLHKILMNNARGTNSARGEFRRIQNFIGPDSKIEHAVYIPVPAQQIASYMENLEFYVNGEHHSSFNKYQDDMYVIDEHAHPILKLAVMHAQFESIHPFLDGNGRLGRILIALMAVKFGIVNEPVFLVSEELEKERLRYYDFLNGVRGEHPDWFTWLSFFLDSTNRMTTYLLDKIRNIQNLAKKGLQSCNTHYEEVAWRSTFANTYITAKQLSENENINIITARKTLNSLVNKKLLFCPEYIIRNKPYINYDLRRLLQ